MLLSEERAALAAAGRRLADRGLVIGTSGNLSQDGQLRFISIGRVVDLDDIPLGSEANDLEFLDGKPLRYSLFRSGAGR